MPFVSDVVSSAQGQWEYIFHNLSVDVPARGKHSPCPICGGEDRFHFDDEEGRGTSFCRGCDKARDGLQLVMDTKNMNASEAAKVVLSTLGNNASPMHNTIPAKAAKDESKARMQAKKETERLLKLTKESKSQYLVNKGLPEDALILASGSKTIASMNFNAGSLIVPVQLGGEIVGAQLINEHGDKAYIRGTQKKGALSIIEGDSSHYVVIGEGYATVKTGTHLLGCAGVIAFDSGNMLTIASQVKGMYPNSTLVWLADLDKNGKGYIKANNASKIAGGVAIVPYFQNGEFGDWNDYFQKHGADSTRSLLLEKIDNDSNAVNNVSCDSSSRMVNQVQSNQMIGFPDIDFNGKPLGTYDNFLSLVKHLDISPSLNAMNLEVEILKKGTPIDATFEYKRSMLISECIKAGLKKSMIDDHMIAACEQNHYHPVKAYLESDVWDRKPRVCKVIEALNAKHQELAKAVMIKWLVACVACLYEKEFSCKLVPILQGGQSFKKTAFIRRIASVVPHSFLEGAELNPDNKDSILSCIKSWITELGELERTSKNSQGGLKAFITKPVDSVRPPYARTDIKKPRQTMLVATVNGTEFLRDETGSSRYAVIELGSAIDMDTVNSLTGWQYNEGRTKLTNPNELKQFWLEIKALYDDGASWELSESELEMTAGINKKHDKKSEFRVLIEDVIAGCSDRTHTFAWMKSADFCALQSIPKNKTSMVGRAMKQLVEEGEIQMKNGSGRAVLYWLPHSIKQAA